MQPLLSSAQMREGDRETIEEFSIPQAVLMEHAGIALSQSLQRRFGSSLAETRGVVLAGPGNNGGDVLVAARILHEQGCTGIFVVLFDQEHTVSESTARQLKILGRLGIAWGRELNPEMLPACDWILDGLLGIGLSRPVEGSLKTAIETVNAFAGRKWIVSADIPSGLSADTGVAQGIAVRASETVSFGFLKKGLVTGQAADHVGKLTLATIQIPRTVSSAGWDTFLYTDEDARRLPRRTLTSHKGDFGHVAILVGPGQTEGAAALSALGALRSGCGLATVVGTENELTSLRPRLPPEVMTEEVEAFFSQPRANVLVVGPGLGTGPQAVARLESALKFSGSLVCDADALNIFASDPERWRARLKSRKATTVLTPHPKEAARLLSSAGAKGEPETQAIQSDRYAALTKLVFRWSCFIVLKGPGTLVGSQEMPVVAVSAGDDGLAKAGTGDLLSGITASLLGQGLKAAQALPLAVYLHGRASQRLSEKLGTHRSSLASDIADIIPEIFRGLECPN